jgi:hypothetical protein
MPTNEYSSQKPSTGKIDDPKIDAEVLEEAKDESDIWY